MNEQLNVEPALRRASAHRRMAIQHYVDLEMNQVVREMRKLVNETDVAGSGIEKHGMGNVLAVALETPSVEEVKLFIEYQSGRDVSGMGWRRNGFGVKLAKALDALRARARDVVTEALHVEEPDARYVDEAWIDLCRRYLGQLNRYFYYKKEAARWPQNK